MIFLAAKINFFKVLSSIIKERIKHPFSYKEKIFEFSEPNIIYGLTDHPLDKFGDPMLDMYTMLKKSFVKKANVIKSISFKGNDGNIFNFSCQTYNIYIKRLKSHVKLFSSGFARKEKITLELQIQILKEDLFRLRCSDRTLPLENKMPMIFKMVNDPSCCAEFQDKEKYYLISTSQIALKLYKDDFRIKIVDAHNHVITESSGKSKNDFDIALDSFPLGFIEDKRNNRKYGVESFILYPNEAIYGFGEQFSPLNKVGRTISLWNYEGLGNSTGRTYKNIPFFLSTRGYGVYVNDYKPITYWVGTRETYKNMFAVENDIIDYFFFYGPNFKKILLNYTELTGRAPVLPKWTFGAWMSRISYSSQDEVLNTAKRLREEKFPFDVIHIDTNWFKEEWMCDWKFDIVRFPNPKEMCQKLKEIGFKLSLWQTPYITKRVKEFKEAKKLNIVAKNHGAFKFFFQPAVVIDFSKKEAIKWYQEKLKNLFKIGVNVIKTDFGEAIEPHQRFSCYNGREMHNLFPLLYQKAAFEITKQFFGNGIIWARSAYAGSQRYPVHWSGDSSSHFEEMLSILRGGLSLGLCGFTYWSQDVGGFISSPTDFLYIRWTQFSIFNSHIRFHGNPPRFREPWNYNKLAQEIVRKFLNLRYKMLPYIYTEAQIASERGLPMMRPLVLEFQQDPTVFNIEDEFFFGRNILVAPILTKENKRMIYLPKGNWFDFWSFVKFKGSMWIEYDCPIDIIPFFIQEGSILPLGPEMQFVEEKPFDSITLLIFPDENSIINEYIILDDSREIQINASFTEGILNIYTSEPFKIITIEVPNIYEIKKCILNNQVLSIKMVKNRIIASKM